MKETVAENRARVGAHRRLTLPVAVAKAKSLGHRKQWRDRRFRVDFRSRMLERFGLDVSGDPAMVAETKRKMRNARKTERRVVLA